MTIASTTHTPADPFTYGGRGGRQRMIPHPETGVPQPYQRVSTFARTLDEPGGLPAWLAWMALKGSQQAPALLQQALHAEKTPKGVIDQLCELGGSKAAASKGSDRHQLLAMALTGALMPDLPSDAKAQLQATLDLVYSLGTPQSVEAATVNDQYGTAGSCDLVVEAPGGQIVVCEFKTGRVDKLSASIQLIAHARGQYWANGERAGWVSWGLPRLVVITAPQDGSPPALHELDVDNAMRWAALAVEVREARRAAARKGA